MEFLVISGAIASLILLINSLITHSLQNVQIEEQWQTQQVKKLVR
jgi:hypothetical protein